jgi:DMSO/TMAO reductase YedYZ heme-binding membrane subunit
MYAIAAIIITSLLWMQKKPKPWRLTHLLSYLVIVLVFAHGLFVGTDVKHGLMRALWIIATLGLVAAILPRLRRARTLDKE